jgi:putative MATE family efflux protein
LETTHIQQNPENENFLGTQPIGALLLRLSFPAMIAMLVNSLYNLVDTIFVGQSSGALAIAALGIAFPIQLLIGGIAQLFGVGVASIVSRKLGEKNEKAAALAAGNALKATVLAALTFAIVGMIFLEPLLQVFGATPDILPFAKDYMGIVFIGAMFVSISMCSNNILRAEGKAKVSMIIMLIGAGMNIILDPIFIFGFGMGIRGAAIATLISQISSSLYAMRFFLKRKSSLPFQKSSFKISFPIIRETISLGLPTLIRQGGSSLMILTANNMLGLYGGDLAIAAYGMISKLMIFFLMPIFGIVQGFQPITGFNYGAKKSERVKQVLYKAIMVTSLMGLLFFAIIQIFPRELLSLFTSSAELLRIAVPALRIVMLALPFIGIQTIGATFFQSIGKSVPALLLGLSRQFIILIPLVLLLPQFLSLNGVWMAFPIADIVSTIITVVWLFHEVASLNTRNRAEMEALAKE